MSKRNVLNQMPRWCAHTPVLLFAIIICATVAVRADEPSSAAPESRAVVGHAVKLPGALLHREGPDKGWHIVKPGSPVYSSDLIVGVPGGAIVAKDAQVRLSLLSDLARVSPYPVLESAVSLHTNPEKDLDLTLNRGRVDVTNLRTEGAAHIRVRFHGDAIWDLTLNQPKTRVAFELYGRWTRGTRFKKDPKATDEPTADLVLLVISGNVDLKAGGHEFAMHAPPGPAYYHWDSAGGADTEPRRMDTLPEWARPARVLRPRTSVVAVLAALRSIGERLAETGNVQEALTESLNSDNPNARRIAVYGLGALDDLPGLIAALSDSKHADVRNIAVVALRHWIGRERGQDLKLYEAFEKASFTPALAEVVVQLLHSFDETDLARPATYETLIDYLLSDKLAIRQLAHWHLERLVPAGKDIAYDVAGPAEERQQGYEKWKKLIPSGHLPSQPKSEGK
jgi:hypothetical protein